MQFPLDTTGRIWIPLWKRLWDIFFFGWKVRAGAYGFIRRAF